MAISITGDTGVTFPLGELLVEGGAVAANDISESSGASTAAKLLTLVKTVDGSGSGLDADTILGRAGNLYASAWDSSRTYAINDFCFFNGIPYRSLSGSNTNNSPDASTLFWTSATANSSLSYGISWNESSDSYSRTGTLSYLAPATKAPDSALTIQSKMRRCLMNDSGVVQYYLSSVNSNFKEDGTASVLTGADGQVMVEIPKFWYRYSFASNTHTWEVSPVAATGFSVHPAFIKESVEKNYIYVGAFEGVLYDVSGATYIDFTSAFTTQDWTATTGDKLSSISGKKPVSKGTRAQFRNIAKNRGTGWSQTTYDFLSAIQVLYLTEYASFNSQNLVGPGISNTADWPAYNSSYPIAATGNSSSVGNSTANTAGSTSCATETTKFMSYRGIENFWGHIWTFVDGMNTNNNRTYVSNSPSVFIEDSSTNYTDIGINNANANGYQNTLLQQSRGFLPATATASSSTKVADYYSQAAGWRVAISGGNSDAAAIDGAFCLDLYSASSVSSSYVGSRLCFA